MIFYEIYIFRRRWFPASNLDRIVFIFSIWSLLTTSFNLESYKFENVRKPQKLLKFVFKLLISDFLWIEKYFRDFCVQRIFDSPYCRPLVIKCLIKHSIFTPKWTKLFLLLLYRLSRKEDRRTQKYKLKDLRSFLMISASVRLPPVAVQYYKMTVSVCLSVMFLDISNKYIVTPALVACWCRLTYGTNS